MKESRVVRKRMGKCSQVLATRRSSEIMLTKNGGGGIKLIQLTLPLRKFLELEYKFQKQRVVKVKGADMIRSDTFQVDPLEWKALGYLSMPGLKTSK